MENETEAERLDREQHREQHGDHSSVEWRGSPSNLLDNKEFWGVFVDCLDGLPETHRRAFSLREIDGVKGDEICKILGITSTNLWVILHRARGKLRTCLEANWFSAE